MAISFQGAPLFKRTSKGKVQFWRIFTKMNEIIVNHGLVNGKMQITSEFITEGKNLNQANATTPEQQAYKEAEARHIKMLKKGYVSNLDAAKEGIVDSLIQGGWNPMLAHSYDDHASKMTFPLLLSPKLDGIRCLASIVNGKASLWTRTRKPILSVPHIVSALEKTFVNQTINLDGELYNSDYKDDFNKIISLVRPDEPVEGHELVQYHIFDGFYDDNNTVFIDRIKVLESFKMKDPLILVNQVLALNINQVKNTVDYYIKLGYEGGMVKNPSCAYEFKRSYNLQKCKMMQDAEFAIVGIEEGRGKLAGHVGSFICKTPDGLEFKAKLEGKVDYLKELFNNTSLWQNKKLTVQFQNYTPDGKPRFPIGKSIRDYE